MNRLQNKKHRDVRSHVLSPVHILLWGHGVGHLLCVDLVNGVQGQLHDEAVDGRVLVHLCDAVKNLQTERDFTLSAAFALGQISDDGFFQSSPLPLLPSWEVSCVWH